MPTHNEAVIINGTTDTTQLVVENHTTQTNPLQQWQTSSASPLARVTSDGRLQIGTFTSGTMDTDDSLIEAHRGESDTSKPKRGLHLMGAINATLNSVVSWVVQELTLKGSSISALHSALRVRLRNEATGASGSAELRGGDIEVINAAASGTMPTMTGLRVAVDQEAGAAATNIYGVKVDMTNVPSSAYALHTTGGKVRLGGLSTGLVRSNGSGDLTSAALSNSDIPNSTITVAKLANGTPNKVIGFNGSGTPIEIDVAGNVNDLVVLEHRLPNNTNGGAATSGSWQIRPINNEPVDTANICTLNANAFTLEPGTYRFHIMTAHHATMRTVARLYNVTAGAVLHQSLSVYHWYISGVGSGGSFNTMQGTFTLTAQSQLRIEQRVQQTQGTNGLGVAANFGEDELYLQATFQRVAY